MQEYLEMERRFKGIQRLQGAQSPKALVAFDHMIRRGNALALQFAAQGDSAAASKLLNKALDHVGTLRGNPSLKQMTLHNLHALHSSSLPLKPAIRASVLSPSSARKPHTVTSAPAISPGTRMVTTAAQLPSLKPLPGITVTGTHVSPTVTKPVPPAPAGPEDEEQYDSDSFDSDDTFEQEDVDADAPQNAQQVDVPRARPMTASARVSQRPRSGHTIRSAGSPAGRAVIVSRAAQHPVASTFALQRPKSAHALRPASAVSLPLVSKRSPDDLSSAKLRNIVSDGVHAALLNLKLTSDAYVPPSPKHISPVRVARLSMHKKVNAPGCGSSPCGRACCDAMFAAPAPPTPVTFRAFVSPDVVPCVKACCQEVIEAKADFDEAEAMCGMPVLDQVCTGGTFCDRRIGWQLEAAATRIQRAFREWNCGTPTAQTKFMVRVRRPASAAASTRAPAVQWAAGKRTTKLAQFSRYTASFLTKQRPVSALSR